MDNNEGNGEWSLVLWLFLFFVFKKQIHTQIPMPGGTESERRGGGKRVFVIITGATTQHNTTQNNKRKRLQASGSTGQKMKEERKERRKEGKNRRRGNFQGKRTQTSRIPLCTHTHTRTRVRNAGAGHEGEGALWEAESLGCTNSVLRQTNKGSTRHSTSSSDNRKDNRKPQKMPQSNAREQSRANYGSTKMCSSLLAAPQQLVGAMEEKRQREKKTQTRGLMMQI